MMDENTKLRHRLDYARVCVIILADHELLMVIQVDVGRPSLFRVEYEWILACCTVCKMFGHATSVCSPKGQNEEVPMESQNQGDTVEGNLQVIPFQQSSSGVFGGRANVEGNPSGVENYVSSHDSS